MVVGGSSSHGCCLSRRTMCSPPLLAIHRLERDDEDSPHLLWRQLGRDIRQRFRFILNDGNTVWNLNAEPQHQPQRHTTPQKKGLVRQKRGRRPIRRRRKPIFSASRMTGANARGGTRAAVGDFSFAVMPFCCQHNSLSERGQRKKI